MTKSSMNVYTRKRFGLDLYELGSTQQIIEQKFRGLRGINCRFAFGAISPVSIEINQIIARRLTDAAGPSPRT